MPAIAANRVFIHELQVQTMHDGFGEYNPIGWCPWKMVKREDVTLN
ncbi:MAG: hypothetical protein KME29_32420 [Calothrix sp. FI2-JRJ7]|jgi:hypothetical protein|nr:hypothetical protein [Calothrix sp. FI2-JRJ7]